MRVSTSMKRGPDGLASSEGVSLRGEPPEGALPGRLTPPRGKPPQVMALLSPKKSSRKDAPLLQAVLRRKVLRPRSKLISKFVSSLKSFIAPFLAQRELQQNSRFTYFDGDGNDATCAFRLPQGEILSVKNSAQSGRAQHTVFWCARVVAARAALFRNAAHKLAWSISAALMCACAAFASAFACDARTAFSAIACALSAVLLAVVCILRTAPAHYTRSYHVCGM